MKGSDRLVNGSICKVDVKRDGEAWVAIIHHAQVPLGDNRKEVPDHEVRAKNHEEMMMEVCRYLEDCYDD